MKLKSYLWTIPFCLSIVCGILNPCGGLISIITVVLSLGLLIFLQNDIDRETKAINRQYGTCEEVASDLSVASWIMTSFTFAVLNALVNVSTIWFCYQNMSNDGVLPKIGFTTHLFNTHQWTISCILFILTIVFHIGGTIMVFIKGAEIKKQYISH